MSIISVTDAAKMARVSRGTIYNKIKDGELTRGPRGIDTAELLRVFGELHDVSNDGKNSTTSKNDDAQISRELAMAEEFLQSMRERVERSEAREARLEAKLADYEDRLSRSAERERALLDGPKQYFSFFGIALCKQRRDKPEAGAAAAGVSTA